MTAPRRPLANLARNLAAGARLCLFRSVPPGQFRTGADDLALLLGFYLLAAAACDYAALAPAGQFNTFAVQGQALRLGLLIAALYFIWRLVTPAIRPNTLLTLLLARAPIFLLAELLIFRLSADLSVHGQRLAEGLLLAWWLGVDWWAFYCVDSTLRRSTARYLIYLSVAFVPVLWLDDYDYRFWLQVDDQTVSPTQALAGQLRPEIVYYRQPILLGEALSRLQAQRPGQRDLYFLGFGGWGDQDVFAKEIDAASALMQERYTDPGYILRLVNDPRRADRLPLASITNLESALMHLGRLMDRDEDLLVLYLTSHGEPGRLGVQMGQLGLVSLTPSQLRTMLDASTIRWRVVIVSACYSGSFVDALRNEQTVVLTASAADRVSNGCRDGNEFTHFGRALWRESLPQATSLMDGLRASIDAVSRRETRDGLEPSRPQLHIGAAIERWLGQ